MHNEPSHAELIRRIDMLEAEVAKCHATEASLKESEAHYRKLYEKSRREEQLYRSLLHSSADAIVIYDVEGRAQYVSPTFTRIFGWTLEEVEGRRIPFLPEAEEARTMAVIDEMIHNGKPCHGFETRRLTKDGRMLQVSISASLYFDDGEKPAGLLVILRDVSERVKMERKLIQAQKLEAIGTLAGGIAHDFNNLLMGIQGNASLLLFKMDPDDPGREKLKNIEKYVQSGADLTKQLLAFARRGKYEVTTMDVGHLLKDSAKMFGRTRKDVSLSVNWPQELWTIEADRGQMEQVLLNLYVNAGQAMPAGGKLFISAENVVLERNDVKPHNLLPGPFVKICVSDTGVGMNESIQEKIFDPFFTTKGMKRGTGLGLASAYGIVKNHNGILTVESKIGEGATFSIFLPASPKAADTTGMVREEVVRGTETVLLVDDEDMILDIGRQLMETLGYTILLARSGREAVELYRRRHSAIDAVILDMIMPDMGGADTYDQLKHIDPDIKVLLSSGYSQDGQAQQILNRGCRGFIQKPFKIEELSCKIREVLDGP